jgi:hypothetical protein
MRRWRRCPRADPRAANHRVHSTLESLYKEYARIRAISGVVF